MPDDIYKITTRAFYNCNLIKEIIIPNFVRIIEEGSFIGCNSLERVALSKRINKIDDFTFFNCKSLKEIDNIENIEEIGHFSFSACLSLEKISLSNNLKIIGDSAFSMCPSLTEIEIPRSLKKIGNDVFSKCDSLERIIFTYDTYEELINNMNKLKKINHGINNNNIKYIFQGPTLNLTNLQQLNLKRKFIINSLNGLSEDKIIFIENTDELYDKDKKSLKRKK